MFRRRGKLPLINSEGLIEYLDSRILELKVMALEANKAENIAKYLLLEGGIIAMESAKKDVLYSIEHRED